MGIHLYHRPHMEPLILTDVRLNDNTTPAYNLILDSDSDSPALDADKTLTFDVNNANRTIDLAGDFTTQNNNVTINAVTAARTITLNENFTIGGGSDVTVTAEDAAGAITLDNVNFEVEDTTGSGNTIKIANATSDASRTITLSEDLTISDGQNVTLHASGGEGAQLAIDTQNAERTLDMSANLTVESTSTVNQDLTSDASPTFANTSLGTGELTTGSINRGSGTLTLEVGGTAIIDIAATSVDFNKLITADQAIATAIDIGNSFTGSQITMTGSSATDHAIEIDGSFSAATIYTHTSSATADTLLWGDMATTVTTGDVNGLRPRLAINGASGDVQARAVYGEVIVGASKFAGLAQGVLAHVSYAANDCTITEINALGAHISQGSGLIDCDNLYAIKATVQTRGDEAIADDDYIMRLDNEAVGGNGREMDGAIQIINTSMGGGTDGFGYGIDMSGANIGTADIVLQNGEVIKNITDGTIEYSGFLGCDFYDEGAENSEFTIDWRNGNFQKVTVTGVAIDINFTAPDTAGKCVLMIVQGDGDDTLDWEHSISPLWPGNVEPTLSTGNADVDIITFFYDASNYYGLFNGDFS